MPVRRYKPGIELAGYNSDVVELLKTGKLAPRKKASLNEY